jgi:uncharacterized membrane protein
MSNIALIYWLTRLSSISNLFFALGLISAVIVGGGLLAYSIMLIEWNTDDDETKYKQKRKTFFNKLWVPILFFVFHILTPDTKEAMLIIAGGKTLDYVQSDTSLQKIPYKATELILKKMEEYIDETTSDSTKTK